MSGPTLRRVDIFLQLHAKLGQNLAAALADERMLLLTESKARLLPEVGTLLQGCSLTATQKEISGLFDEIFSDLACALYLSACALDVPARMLLRRSLEIGVATLYLWDRPVTFWAWREHDEDLSFKEMLEMVASSNYRTFVRKENPDYDGAEIINAMQCNALYRKFSNVMHGKISSFESYNPDRFTHTNADWSAELTDISSVVSTIINAWAKRSPAVYRLLKEGDQ